MRLRFINPNSTASMTETVLLAAQAAASAELSVEAVTSRTGPPAIQGEADGLAALPGLLDEVSRARADGVDAIVIACFDDTGIVEARAAAGSVPVLGIGQAACLECLLRGQRFSVVTTLAVSIPVIEANLRRAGLAAGCLRVRASGVPVLELERSDGSGRERVAAEIARALDEDGAEAIVLGCAGMAEFADELQTRFGVPVVDGVVAATRLARALKT